MSIAIFKRMNKFFITLSILIITTSAFSKDTKDSKKINLNICKNDIKNGRILGFSGNL